MSKIIQCCIVLISLSGISQEKFKVYYIEGDNGYKINKDFYKVKDFALTPCYLISLNGANKLLKLLPIDRPVDSWLSHVSNKINIYRHNIIRPYSKYPSSSLVRQSTIKSQIAHTNNF